MVFRSTLNVKGATDAFDTAIGEYVRRPRGSSGAPAQHMGRARAPRARNGAGAGRESGRGAPPNTDDRSRGTVASVSGEWRDPRERPRRGRAPDRAWRALPRAARARRRRGGVSRCAGDCGGGARPDGSAAGRQHDGARRRALRAAGLRRSRDLYRRALAVVETAYGAEDPRITGPLASLAGLYRKWERWDDAAALYLRLAGVFERILGANNFHVAMTLEHVADAHAAEGQYAEAEQLSGKVLGV